MAYTPSLLYPTSCPAAAGSTLYTAPAGNSVIIKNVVLTNTTALEAAVNISIVPNGGNATTSNRILSGFLIPAHGVSTLDLSIVMPTGAFIYASNVTENAVTVTISGVEIS